MGIILDFIFGRPMIVLSNQDVNTIKHLIRDLELATKKLEKAMKPYEKENKK